MSRHLSAVSFILLILVWCSLGFADQTQQVRSAETVADTIVAAINLIDERHIDPPTKQEMLKRVINRIRTGPKAANWSLKSVGVASLASGLSTDKQFRDTLMAEFKEHPSALLADNDPMVSLLSPLGLSVQLNKDAIVQKQIQANRYVGVGIQISVKGGIPMMQRVLPGGPAEKGGAQHMDLIVAVDGQPTQDIPLRTVVDWLRGSKGTAVDVQLKRGNDLIDMTLVRNEVPMKTVIVKYVPAGPDQIAVVSFAGLGASSVHELREIEKQALDKGVIGVILDLRLDGALAPLHETTLLADALIANRSLGFHQTRQSTSEIKAGPTQMFDDMRMVVLVNGVVRGPAEWLAAALQSSGALLIGDSTAGQGMSVETVSIPKSRYSITIPVGILKNAKGTSLYLTNRNMVSPIPSMSTTMLRRPGPRPPKRNPHQVHPDSTIDPKKISILDSAVNHIRLLEAPLRTQDVSEVPH